MKRILLFLTCFLVLSSVSKAATETETFTISNISFTSGTNQISYKGDKFTITFTKENASNVPAFYSPSIRMYYNSGGAGNALTVTSNDNEAIITSIKTTCESSYTFPGAASCKTAGASYSSSGTSQTWDFSSYVESATIQNTNTSNKQVRVSAVEVSYFVADHLKNANLAFNGVPETIEIDEILDLSTYLSKSDEYTGEIVYSADPIEAVSFAGSIMTAKKAGNVTVTATLPETEKDFYGVASFSINIIDPNDIYTEITPQFFNYVTNSYGAVNQTDEFGVKYSANYLGSNTQMQFNTNNGSGKGSGVNVMEISDNYIITTIDVEMSDNASGFNVYTSDKAFSELKTSSAPTTKDATQLPNKVTTTTKGIEINAKAFAIHPSSTGAMYIQKITVHYAKVEPEPAEPVDYEALNGYNDQEYVLEVGGTMKLELGDEHPKINFEIDADPEGCVTINAEGLIEAQAEGVAMITATWQADDNFNANEEDGITFMVTVEAAGPTAPVIETSYTIIFDDNNSDASTELTSQTFLGYITEGNDKVNSASGISKVYKGKTGIKFGTGSAVGTIDIDLVDKVTPTKIVVNASAYNASSVTLSVNNVENTISGTNLADYEYTFSSPVEISSIKLATSDSGEKRAYIKAITVYYEVEANYTFSGQSESHTVEADHEAGTISVYGLAESDLDQHETLGWTYQFQVGHEAEGVTVYYKVTSAKSESAPANVKAMVAEDGYTAVEENGIVDLPVDDEMEFAANNIVKYGYGTLSLYYETVDGYKSQPVTYTYTVSTDNDGAVATGVEGVEAAEGGAEYFNLQGQKVANPDKGIYIKVAGGKVSKVIL